MMEGKHLCLVQGNIDKNFNCYKRIFFYSIPNHKQLSLVVALYINI